MTKGLLDVVNNANKLADMKIRHDWFSVLVFPLANAIEVHRWRSINFDSYLKLE